MCSKILVPIWVSRFLLSVCQFLLLLLLLNFIDHWFPLREYLIDLLLLDQLLLRRNELQYT